MAWTKIQFGRHWDKTIPQVLFEGPAWFWWAIKNRAFRDFRLNSEAQDVADKARRIVLHDGASRK